MNHHPASEIFDMLRGAEFEKFAEEIKAKGLIDPIIKHPDGSILDGRNRYKACKEKGIEPRYVTWDGRGVTEVDFVWQVNSNRRHLTAGAKQMAGARYAAIKAREATARGHANLIPDGLHRFDHSAVPIETAERPKRSREDAAEKLGVSPTSLARASVVLKHGSPEEIKAVEAGKIPVSRVAANIAKRRRGEEPVIELVSIPSNHINVPSGYIMETWALSFFRRNEAGESIETIAKEAGVNHQTAQMMAEILAVASRKDLPPAEILMAKKAVSMMNEQKQVSPAYVLVEPITERLWGPKTERRGKRSAIEKSRWHRFETMYATLVGLCSSAGALPIPHIEKEKTVQILKELKAAVADMNALRNKLGRVWEL